MQKFALNTKLPVAIVGAGPVGLTTALGLAHFGIPFILLEDDSKLSMDTKAGSLLTRTLEVFHRFGVADKVLEKALRVDEIGEFERASNRMKLKVSPSLLRDETRFPFVINLPQHDLEPVLAAHLEASGLGSLRFNNSFKKLEELQDRVKITVDTPDGEEEIEASYLLACDGGRSAVRDHLGLTVEGHSLAGRYSLVDIKVDLDVENPRDYPYMSYFSDPDEWMVLVRQPQCWRFLFPLPDDRESFTEQELRDKAVHFIGDINNVEVLGSNIYMVHHRVAHDWRVGRCFLMGDAAHLITPMWALGLNTGVLDASNLPWRLAWVMREWADDALLDGYEREQRPVAVNGSGELAEAARHHMNAQGEQVNAMTDNDWGNAYTRTMLAVRLDVEGSGDWSMVKTAAEPPPVEVGDRAPDCLLHASNGREIRLHDLFGSNFVALYFTDTRRRPQIPENDFPGLKHFIVSRWDAPIDSGIRDQSLLDSGDTMLERYGCSPDTLVLVRPDDHIAAICPIEHGKAEVLYRQITGQDMPKAQS